MPHNEYPAQAGISTTVISDAAIFAIMARVNKVIVGCSAVLANGGIVSHVGMHNIALAAKHHSVPFVVCTGMFKLSPTFPHDQYSLSELQSPANIGGIGADSIDRSVRVLNPKTDYIPPQLVSRLRPPRPSRQTQVRDARVFPGEFGSVMLGCLHFRTGQRLRWDAILGFACIWRCANLVSDASQIDLFLTNAGGHNPSYIYRLLAEYYSMQDQNL